MEGNVADCLDVERVEEQLAELAIPGPGLARLETLERTDVDEHRLAAHELHVVGAGVLGDQLLGKGLTGERQLQPGRVAQHLERPLVGVRQHVDPGVTEDGSPIAGQRGGVGGTLGGDDVAAIEGGGVEVRGGQCLEVGERLSGQATPDGMAVDIDPRQRVTERPAVGSRAHAVGIAGVGVSPRRHRAVRREPPRPGPCASSRTRRRCGVRRPSSARRIRRLRQRRRRRSCSRCPGQGNSACGDVSGRPPPRCRRDIRSTSPIHRWPAPTGTAGSR